jgi:2-phospho-L-lactate guanylyltransferase
MIHDKLWAVIPAKPLYRAKTRLSKALRSGERVALVRMMLSHTLDTLSSIERIDGVVVISADRAQLNAARDKNATALAEKTALGLNPALRQACAWLRDVQRADTALILPADLPLVTESDIESILDLAFEESCVVLAPDRRDEGTNAILLRPPDVMEPAFGPGSFERHRQLAIDRGVPVRTYRSATIALDIDLPDDLNRFRELSTLYNALSLGE